MRVFRIVRIKLNNGLDYFRVDEKVGFVFKRWEPVVTVVDHFVVEEMVSYDYRDILGKLRSMFPSNVPYKIDSGYSEYR